MSADLAKIKLQHDPQELFRSNSTVLITGVAGRGKEVTVFQFESSWSRGLDFLHSQLLIQNTGQEAPEAPDWIKKKKAT